MRNRSWRWPTGLLAAAVAIGVAATWWAHVDGRPSVATTSLPPGELDGPRLRQLQVCTQPCRITGRVEFDHPAWGRVTLVTTQTLAESRPRDAHLAVVDAAGRVRWHHRAGDWWEVGPAEPARDRTGHIFINYNPGRYNGVIVLGPTAAGFATYGSLPAENDFRSRFYSADLTDVERDGQYEIDLAINECELSETVLGRAPPPCAEGRFQHTVFRWNGTDYVA